MTRQLEQLRMLGLADWFGDEVDDPRFCLRARVIEAASPGSP